jgi:hypothetical protein
MALIKVNQGCSSAEFGVRSAELPEGRRWAVVQAAGVQSPVRGLSRLIKADQGWAEVNFQIIRAKIIRLGERKG